MTLLIATRNKDKLREIREIFSLPALKILSVDDFQALPEVEEDVDTFEGNAIKKAVTLAREAQVWAMADDSGLEVDALGGAPGVWSARYAGEPADYEANNRKLLKEMDGEENRTARFRCVMALSNPEGESRTVDGSCEGEITLAPRGANGFGYDPVFVPEGYAETFAEMDSALKHRLSHRGHALEAARQAWADILSSVKS